MTLRHAYEHGYKTGLVRFKLALGGKSAPPAKATSPIVRNSTLTRSQTPPNPADGMHSAETATNLATPATPQTIGDASAHAARASANAGPTQNLIPKIGASEICTTCRREKHYGPCAKPERTKGHGVPITFEQALKNAGFNAGLTGDDPSYATTGEDAPAMSPNYHAATTGDSSLAQIGRAHV